jgi:hypothetical protein
MKANCTSESEESQTPSIEIRGEELIVNGKEIAYEHQMLTKNSLYLVDEGIDLPIEEGIKDYDDRYFDFRLLRLIISELEVVHPSVGLQEMQALGNLT